MSTGSKAADREAGAGAGLTALAEARARLLARLVPVAPMSLPLAQVAGRVLAADVIAPADAPPGALALRAGLAVASLDTVGASPFSPAILPAAPVRVRSGEALPPGCDALLPEDAVALEGPFANRARRRRPRRGRAADRRGRPARRAARGGGYDALACRRRRPRGLRRRGGRRPRAPPAHRCGRPPASPAARLLADLTGAAGGEEAADSEFDLAALLGPVFPEDFEVSTGGLALRPGGEAMALGSIDGVPAVAMADRPEAALAAWLGLLAPALARLAGAPEGVRMIEVELSGKAASTPGFDDLVVLGEAHNGRCEVLAVGDVAWSVLVSAAAAALIAADSEGVPAGGRLAALPL